MKREEGSGDVGKRGEEVGSIDTVALHVAIVSGQ
jgi:hypothetical protein